LETPPTPGSSSRWAPGLSDRKARRGKKKGKARKKERENRQCSFGERFVLRRRYDILKGIGQKGGRQNSWGAGTKNRMPARRFHGAGNMEKRSLGRGAKEGTKEPMWASKNNGSYQHHSENTCWRPPNICNEGKKEKKGNPKEEEKREWGKKGKNGIRPWCRLGRLAEGSVRTKSPGGRKKKQGTA